MIGPHCSGKTSFCQNNLKGTWTVISNNETHLRADRCQLLDACLREGQSCVVDDMNLTREDRERYISVARAAGAKVVGFLFDHRCGDVVERPSLDEGFDELRLVVRRDRRFAHRLLERRVRVESGGGSSVEPEGYLVERPGSRGPVWATIRQLEHGATSEKMFSVEEFKGRVDGLRFQLIENWCLCKYCQLYDSANENYGHWVAEFCACANYLRRFEV